MGINPARWPAVTALFSEVASLPPGIRTQRLNDIDDIELRDEVRSLLEADSAVGDRFERAPVLVTNGTRSVMELSPPTTVGAWRIVRHVGDGGMGTVYEAVRDDAGFTKRAALKMLQARGAANPALVQRFEAERRMLARLSHRNIATLFDGGVHDDGRPWFAMEYVEGESLVQWCTSRALDTRARVQLLRQACSAVQYAHEHLIVHRDIKPANMLVSADGTLKLLDFGIARLTDDSTAPLTQAGDALMTAAYASPEQRAGRPVTTATDIWSLGVVLYEVLTGQRPGTGNGGDGAPVLPSARVSDAARRPDATAADSSALRRTGHTLRGELDAIVMMCLRPEPDRRYTSAAELGRDLQRWLEGRTVLARPDTLRYRATMFVRRNRLASAALTVAVIALVTSTIVSMRQADIARRERDRARVEQVRTERVAAFFQQVLNDAVPRRGGRALTVSEALTRAVPIIDTAFSSEPDLKAAVQLSLGSTLQNLEQPERARPLLRAAYAYFRQHDGATASRDQTDALWDLANLARTDGQLAEAESLYVQLAAIYRQPGHAKNDAALSLLRVAGIRTDAGDLAGAIAAYDSLLPQLEVRTRDDSLDLAANVGSRGVALTALGRFDRATTDFAQALRLNEALLGTNSVGTGQVLQPYAAAMLFTGRVAVAESLARRALVISRREYGDGTAATLGAMRMLGTVLVSAGRCAEATTVFTDILAHRGKDLADSDPTVGYALAHRGFCRAQSGDVRGGIADAQAAVPLSAAAVGTQHYAYHLAQSLAGAALGRGTGNERAQGARLLREGADGLRRTLDASHARVREADERLATFQRRVGVP